MIPEMFFLPPAAVTLDAELTPLPVSWKLGFAGAVALVTALVVMLG